MIICYMSWIQITNKHSYKDLLKENPNAKVILTIRDTPEQWYNSNIKTVYALSQERVKWGYYIYSYFMWYSEIKISYVIHKTYWKNPDIFADKFHDKEFAINKYNTWIDEVKEYVPKDQLLIFNIKHGWEPLCTFLGKNIPNEYKTTKAIPVTNNAKEFTKMLDKMRIINYYSNIIIISIIILCLSISLFFVF